MACSITARWASACCFSRSMVRFLGRELVSSRVDGDGVIAVVDLGEDVASTDGDVLLDGHGGDDAGDFGRNDGQVGLDVRIVCRHEEPAFSPPVMAIIPADAEGRDQSRRQQRPALARTLLGILLRGDRDVFQIGRRGLGQIRSRLRRARELKLRTRATPRACASPSSRYVECSRSGIRLHHLALDVHLEKRHHACEPNRSVQSAICNDHGKVKSDVCGKVGPCEQSAPYNWNLRNSIRQAMTGNSISLLEESQGVGFPCEPVCETAKRRQIMEGARRIFLQDGFDGASVGDIVRAAGVSKGTLYAYFPSKEKLFEALIIEDRRKQAEALFTLDETDHDVVRVLRKLGNSFLDMLLSPDNLDFLRIVVGASTKFPQLGKAFFDAGPCQGSSRLGSYFQRLRRRHSRRR